MLDVLNRHVLRSATLFADQRAALQIAPGGQLCISSVQEERNQLHNRCGTATVVLAILVAVGTGLSLPKQLPSNLPFCLMPSLQAAAWKLLMPCHCLLGSFILTLL